jgi:rod shape-determining protein MreC
MEPFLIRYRNLVVLLVILLAQIIGLAMQVRRATDGRVSLDVPDGGGVRLIRLWANALVSPPERLIHNLKLGSSHFWENYADLRHVRQENGDLQKTIDRLRLEQAALLEDARQGQRLQAMLDFQEKYIYKTVAAQAIGTSGSDLSHVFYIDKGTDAKLDRDMAVITSDGIVGKIREVFPRSAQVLAINDQTSGAGVILETTRIRGVLRGNVQGQPQIVGILADSRIQPGEKVLTAGGDQIFPRGLPVGVVEKVERDPDHDGFIDVIVKPAAHLDRLDEVLVISSTEPRFSQEEQKDIATSQALKGPEAAALKEQQIEQQIKEQQKASQVMAERLPGLTDPNAPPAAAAGANGAPANGAPATPAVPEKPKVLPPLHRDRFMPGSAPSPDAGGDPGAVDNTPHATTRAKPEAKPAKSAAPPPAPKRNP